MLLMCAISQMLSMLGLPQSGLHESKFAETDPEMTNQAFLLEQVPHSSLEPETSLEHDFVQIVMSSVILASEMTTNFCQFPRFVKCVPGSGHSCCAK
jgi:hypothetical protein